MSRLLSFSFAAAALLLAAGCDSGSDDTFDVTRYVGTYSGTIRIAQSGSGAPAPTEVPTAVIVTADESARTMTVTIPTDATNAIVLNGSYDDDGAVFANTDIGGTLTLRLDPDGDISGDGTIPFFDVRLRMDADGKATGSRFDLTFDYTVTEGNGGTTPTGTRGTITIKTTRTS